MAGTSKEVEVEGEVEVKGEGTTEEIFWEVTSESNWKSMGAASAGAAGE